MTKEKIFNQFIEELQEKFQFDADYEQILRDKLDEIWDCAQEDILMDEEEGMEYDEYEDEEEDEDEYEPDEDEDEDEY